MTGARHFKLLASLLISSLCSLVLSTLSASAAQPAPSLAPDVEQLQQSYWQHSMHRNDIASQLTQLWRQEKQLMIQYEVSGRSDEQVDFYLLARQLKQVRLDIDSLRSQLSQENRVIQKIGALIPD